ncbi:hypothetical protein L798_01140 [Zootermopsis nevadensis]|uniref:Uncharacterized protein n=1 Tax=Zootermopsis nevadensis TaxID=136037 RepID=A0A067QT99_ZOONE|nr:hypothetical protein L798_01140 [Zootermopsis nevadensis]
MAIPIRYIVQVTLVIFLVSVTSSRGVADGAVSDEGSQEVEDSGDFLSTVVEYALATNFIDVLPHPIRSAILVVKEVLATLQGFTLNLPQLLQNPVSFFTNNILQIVALVLALVSFIPPLALPAKVIALILSILSLLIGLSTPFDKEYLTEI